MEDKKRTVMAVIIIVVVLAAVLYSFFLNLFTPTPHLEMPDPDASQSMDLVGEESGWPEGVAVEYFSAGQSVGTVTAQVWADGGWTRTSAALNSGAVEHSIVGEDTLWLWYEGDGGRVYAGPAADRAADLAQRLPTYEDVLALEKQSITAAGYEERGGQPSVYVEAETALSCVERYWVSVHSGLLVAAEMEQDGTMAYSMAARDVVSPLDETQGVFTLPDGTVLYQPGE